jgi:L-fuculose-phosphate aldolase
MSLSFPGERHALLQAALKMAALGLNEGAAGNLSLRVEEGLLVTPSALPYDEMGPGDIVLLDWEGETLESPAGRKPTSEWRFHRDILASRPEFAAVAHCHSPFATTIASWERGIPAVHYMIALAGGNDIRCAPYATFGEQALSDRALEALEGRRACLLAHHGQIACGASLEKALDLAREVESLAALYWRLLQLGEPKVLGAEEMARVLEKFRDYRP